MSRIIPLVRLQDALDSVDLGDAGVHQVVPISGLAMQLVHAARNQEEVLGFWDAAALCVPSAPRTAILALSVQQVEAIISIASGGADRVLAQVGNASAPTTGDASVPAP